MRYLPNNVQPPTTARPPAPLGLRRPSNYPMMPTLTPKVATSTPVVQGTYEVPVMDRRAAATLRGLGGLAGPFDFLKNVVPQGTVVGKLLAGKTQEAATDAARLVQKGSKAMIPGQANPVAIGPGGEALYTPQSNFSTPVLIGGALAGVALIWFLVKR